MREAPLNLTIIEPPESTFTAVAEDRNDEQRGIVKVFDRYDPDQDDWLDELEDTAKTVADAQNIFLDVQRLQLFHETPPGDRKIHMMQDAEILITANASEEIYAILTNTIRKNPVQRCVFSFNTNEDLERHIDVLKMARVPVFVRRGEEVIVQTMPRLFGIIRADRKRLQKVLEQCLTYAQHDHSSSPSPHLSFVRNAR